MNIAIFSIVMSVVWFVVLCFVTWVWFVAMMALQRVRDVGKLTGIAKWFGYILLVIGTPADFILNFAASLFFLEIPRYRDNEWLFTARMKRYYYRVVERPNMLEWWRKKAGVWITEGLLNNVSSAVGSGNHV